MAPDITPVSKPNSNPPVAATVAITATRALFCLLVFSAIAIVLMVFRFKQMKFKITKNKRKYAPIKDLHFMFKVIMVIFDHQKTGSHGTYSD
jgi:hypothetical protein